MTGGLTSPSSPAANPALLLWRETCIYSRTRMHELSLVESIKDIALRHGRLERASRILSLRVVIGGLSSHVEDAIVMFWDEISSGTEAGARLEFVHVPGELLCLHCLKTFAVRGTGFRCPDCDNEWVRPIAGEDCYLDSIQVEVAQEA